MLVTDSMWLAEDRYVIQLNHSEWIEFSSEEEAESWLEKHDVKSPTIADLW